MEDIRQIIHMTEEEYIARFLPRLNRGDIDEARYLTGLARVKPKKDSQTKRMHRFLMDGEWHDTPEIQEAVYGKDHLGSAAIPSRVSDLRKEGHCIEGRVKEGSIWEYRLVLADNACLGKERTETEPTGL